ncbi:hypothetical protein BJX68DRAFT_269953 [Aspergillus pseudodeflectus]|uniref:Fungal N-terminal domain-containing protein n=1 Tax=Aspergillus pseudodeflectus TaxID=176178 RepID=A0ABR4JXK7_9EURO
MASPFKVEDIYLLGHLAIELGNAFSKGRKSAPLEFREVENQLYSLRAALQALRNEIRDGPTVTSLEGPIPSGITGAQDEDVVGRIVESCNETLKHLDTVIKKYSVLGKSTSISPLSTCARVAGAERMLMLCKIGDRTSGMLKSLFVKKMRLLGCASFKQKVKVMRLQLFIHTLQYPTPSEKKKLTLQASTVYTEHFRVCDAEVSIRESTTTSRFRLTIVSQYGLTIVSQELAETLLIGLASGHNSDFRSPAYVVQLDETGVRRVKNYAQGFSVLGFSDVTEAH